VRQFAISADIAKKKQVGGMREKEARTPEFLSHCHTSYSRMLSGHRFGSEDPKQQRHTPVRTQNDHRAPFNYMGKKPIALETSNVVGQRPRAETERTELFWLLESVAED